MRSPDGSSRHAPAPTTPAYTRPDSGWPTAPTAGRPSTARPIMTTNPDSPRTKSRVPSIGSTIHTRGFPRRSPVSGSSSDSTTSSGNASCRRATISALAAWSASLTGSSPAFVSTCSLVPW